MEDFKLPPIAVPNHEVDSPAIPIRFKIKAEAIRLSLDETIENILKELVGAEKEYVDYIVQSKTEFMNEYKKPEGDTLPVSFTPVENFPALTKLNNARLRWEFLNREYNHYRAYLEYITSEDRLLEITVGSTVFFMGTDELEKKLEIDDEDEEEDIFAQAEKKQRELLLGKKG